MFTSLSLQMYGSLNGRWYLCSFFAPSLPPAEEHYASLGHTSDVGFIDDLHWTTGLGRRDSVPVLSRSSERHNMFPPVLLCSWTCLEECTQQSLLLQPGPQREETLGAGWDPMHSQKLSGAKPS